MEMDKDSFFHTQKLEGKYFLLRMKQQKWQFGLELHCGSIAVIKLFHFSDSLFSAVWEIYIFFSYGEGQNMMD